MMDWEIARMRESYSLYNSAVPRTSDGKVDLESIVIREPFSLPSPKSPEGDAYLEEFFKDLEGKINKLSANKAGSATNYEYISSLCKGYLDKYIKFPSFNPMSWFENSERKNGSKSTIIWPFLTYINGNFSLGPIGINDLAKDLLTTAMSRLPQETGEGLSILLKYAHLYRDIFVKIYREKMQQEPRPEAISISLLLSNISESIFFKQQQPTSSSKGCFIATACCDSAFAPEVIFLKDFRDNIMQRSALGTAVIKIYYVLSPPVARFISRHSYLKKIVRACLIRPIVAFISSLWKPN
jgi:hypothetical protein